MAVPTVFARIRAGAELSRAQDSIATTLNPVAQAVASTPMLGAAPPAWNPPDYAADFVNVTGYAPSSWHRDALGYVWGRIGASTAAGQGAGTVIFTLPEGDRPGETMPYALLNGSTGALNMVTVDPTGAVTTLTAIGAGESVVGAFSFLAEL